MKEERVISWFSCGAASAVATKLAIEKYGAVLPCYTDTSSEHPDNTRFIKDCEKWFGCEVKLLKSKKYSDIWDVFEKTKYLVGVNGARCTTELKKIVRRDFQEPDDIQIFGFTSEERGRVERFVVNNPEVHLECPLIDQNITKRKCFEIIQKQGIELPMMYRMGYRNNNCIGCVKGGAGYWNKIRKDFPEVFERMAKVERQLDVAINKKNVNGKRTKLFLDKLPESMGKYGREADIECNLFCGEKI